LFFQFFHSPPESFPIRRAMAVRGGLYAVSRNATIDELHGRT